MADSVTADFRPEVVITLKFPIEVEGSHYSSLTMRRPKAKDSLAAGKVVGNQDEKALRMFSRLCNVAPEVLEELDQFDMDSVSEQFNRFTARS